MSSARTPLERVFEPNIIHNPRTWMGVWTPRGWRIHAKRWGRAEKLVRELQGDGRTTLFPGALCDPRTGEVPWSDDLHLADDPFTDGGIYPCDPRVESPLGTPRWSVSHSLLCYPHADHTLWTHEYVWDLARGDLQTHFRRHFALEAARTDGNNGRTVTVANGPLSTVIEGNECYDLPNSAVRGVWDNPQKLGRNYYTERVCCLLNMANGVYVRAPWSPVVQCYGLYATAPDDNIAEYFDPETTVCIDRDRLQRDLLIPCDLPRLGMIRYPLHEVQSAVYEGSIRVPSALFGTITPQYVEQLAARRGVRFEPGRVGFAATNSFNGLRGADGYLPAFDLNGDGAIDGEDEALLRANIGRQVRYNLYLDGYFGGDWLSTSCCLEPEHRPGTPLIVDYEYGGGYTAGTREIRLVETPGPNQPVWVEYHYDAPAEAGETIRVHLYREPEA